MTELGSLPRAQQAVIVDLYRRAMVAATARDAPSFMRRIDLEHVTADVLAGLFERLRHAGVTYRMEGLWLVMGR